MAVIYFNLLFQHSSEQKDENLSRESKRERERESWPKYDSNNTDTRVDVLLRKLAYSVVSGQSINVVVNTASVNTSEPAR
jgi:hypothetical protein